MPQRKCTIDEVHQFIANTRYRYQSLVERLKSDFRSIARTPSFRSKISGVYSRGDVGYDELKHPWTICAKVNSIRFGGYDALGNERPPQANFAIRDLWDIFGVTIACVFPSDVDEVRDWLHAKIASGSYKEQHDRLNEYTLKLPGYEGIHYVVHPMEHFISTSGARCNSKV